MKLTKDFGGRTVLTKEIFEAGRSSKGQFNKRQLELLGLDIQNLWKGWQQDIIGETYKFETLTKFINLKDSHIKRK